MIARPELYASVFETPLMISDRKAAAIAEAIGPRILGAAVFVEGAEAVAHTPQMGRISDRLGRAYDAERRQMYDMVGDVAVIPIEGSLVHKGAFVGASSGRTSYQGLQAQIVRAARDKGVKGVAFEVDSFGGLVSGLYETADMIFELSKMKPTMAILTDHALSAAYLLASAARQIVVPETGEAGSIGAVMLHADMSTKLEKEGVRVTVMRAGARKATMNPFEALPDGTRARVEASLENARQSFAARVGRYRAGRFNALQALATQGEEFDGPDAVAIGLADAVGHASSAFDAFVREVGRGGRS